MDSRTENLKAELKRLHVETAERVVRRRLDFLVGWLDTVPDEDDFFFVHLRQTWQAFRHHKQKPANAGGEGRGASPRTSPPPCSTGGEQ